MFDLKRKNRNVIFFKKTINDSFDYFRVLTNIFKFGKWRMSYIIKAYCLIFYFYQTFI